MYTHGGQRLKQWQLFAQSKEKDRKYRSQLKYTGPYEGTLTPYDALLASGGKVVLFNGQARSDDRTVARARWTKAMEDMSHNTKIIFLADCAATLIPPPCPLHSTAPRMALPWAQTVEKLLDVGVIPHPWRKADGTVHEDYESQLYCAKIASLGAAQDNGFAKSQQSATAHRARERNGMSGPDGPVSRTDSADYEFLRQQRRVEAGIRLLGRPPTRVEYLANPELFEPNLEQPTYADNVRCASCGLNVHRRGGLVFFPHNHDTGILIITLVCRWCDTSGRVLVDRFLFYNVAASDMPLGAECLLRLLRRQLRLQLRHRLATARRRLLVRRLGLSQRLLEPGLGLRQSRHLLRVLLLRRRPALLVPLRLRLRRACLLNRARRLRRSRGLRLASARARRLQRLQVPRRVLLRLRQLRLRLRQLRPVRRQLRRRRLGRGRVRCLCGCQRSPCLRHRRVQLPKLTVLLRLLRRHPRLQRRHRLAAARREGHGWAWTFKASSRRPVL